MDFRYFWFLSVGLARVYWPPDHKGSTGIADKLCEPRAASVCRRNILVLSGTLVVAGLADVEPKDLRLFGMTPSRDWGVIVLGAAAVLAQVYWYVLRYQHLKDDGEIEQAPAFNSESAIRVKIDRHRSLMARKGADLVANWAAFLMTVTAWALVGSWMLEALRQ